MESVGLVVDLVLFPRGPDHQGILIEFDGPHHYYAPTGPNGELYHTSFTKHRIRLMENLGFKVFVLPFYWNNMEENIDIMEPNSSKSYFSFDKFLEEVIGEYNRMK